MENHDLSSLRIPDRIEKLFDLPGARRLGCPAVPACLYMWRTSEPARRTTREGYPEAFRMTLDDIKNAPEVPPIPPLLRRSEGREAT